MLVVFDSSALVEPLVEDVLWNRMAEDPTFLTSPVPPFSECIPPLSRALRDARERRLQAANRWRPQLDLPAVLREVAMARSGSCDQLLDDWLADLVSGALRACDEWTQDALEETGAAVLQLPRHRWR